MAFKRNSPGCVCCLTDGSSIGALAERVSDINLLEHEGNGVTTSLFGGAIPTTLTVSTITELGAGAVVVGQEVENSRWLCQRTNGEVWTIDRFGEDPVLLWGTGADSAGESLRFVKWHPTWGYASACNATQHFSLDEDGNFVQGPYTAKSSFTCTDASGNIYYRISNTTINQNGAAFTDTARGTRFGQTAIFHDGTDLYSGEFYPLVGSSYGIFRTTGIGSPPVLVVETVDLKGSAGGSNDAMTGAIWDAKRNEVCAGFNFADGGGYITSNYRFSLDLEHLMWIHDAASTVSGSAPIFCAPTGL